MCRTAPEPFKVVKLPLLRREHMDDDATRVEQYPAAVGVALDACGAEPTLAQCQRDRIGNRARLNLRTSGRDDECIGENALADQIDRLNIFSFLIERRLAHGLKQIAQKVRPSCVHEDVVRAPLLHFAVPAEDL